MPGAMAAAPVLLVNCAAGATKPGARRAEHARCWRRVSIHGFHAAPNMSTSPTVLLMLLALLGFWCVGAYNRLVRLRNALVRRFAPVDEQFKLRQGLLRAQCDALGAVLGDAGMPLLEALRAAGHQADNAHERARNQKRAQDCPQRFSNRQSARKWRIPRRTRSTA